MAKFQAGKYHSAAGTAWVVWAINEADSNHPFVRQRWFDGNLSFESLLWQAKRQFRVENEEIELYGNGY